MIDWETYVGAPCVAVFGEAAPCTYYPVDGSASFPVVPVFDEAYRELILLDPENPITDAQPVMGINDRQFVTPPKQSDRIFCPRNGKTYIVRDVRPDSHGVTKLMLQESDPVP